MVTLQVFWHLENSQPLPSQPLENIIVPLTEEEQDSLSFKRLNHVQDLSKYRAEANDLSLKRLEQEALRRENHYIELGISIGNTVMRYRTNRANKLEPKWDGPFTVIDSSDKNTYQLQTPNGYVLRQLVNGEKLRKIE